MINAPLEKVLSDARPAEPASHASAKEKFDMLSGMLKETQVWLS